jgi:hypothetical protein
MDENQAFAECFSDKCGTICLGENDIPGISDTTCEDTVTSCLKSVLCCPECAQQGAAVINCGFRSVGGCDNIVCNSDGTTTSGAATIMGAAFAMLSIAALHCVA